MGKSPKNNGFKGCWTDPPLCDRPVCNHNLAQSSLAASDSWWLHRSSVTWSTEGAHPRDHGNSLQDEPPFQCGPRNWGSAPKEQWSS